MKKTILSLLLFSGLAAGLKAQSDKYVAAMKKNLELFDSAKTTEEYQAVSAAFQRIGDAEKNQWLPYYYAGLALTIPAWTDTHLDKDENSGKIKSFCEKASALAATDPERSEILAVRNMAGTQQMLVDPQTRYMSYGQEANADLQKAMELNPDNPRLYYLQGAGLFGTPEQFGGGKDKAKPILEKAVELFKAEHPKPLYPHWGMKQAEEMLAQCNE